ncbi:hypothetical protein BST63_02005 [Bradyrhizobium canariense]|uniref:Uncharacterized protein n=1 Tax=Bradyrhizobium canariense TaxID=255045 RepID=A0ABX3XB24_9BRAD|nr:MULTISPECIES: hypothetical protein [Bradyrhizobium]OSJ19614.1 hypothetical protein BSR47_02130 [Bradyrhizobium canariense]OSJ35422.1 hypothetical protein BST63_02005 [Bradyrhizobium canariense]WOH61738.1 hypothetical protein RX329_17250 [Bradyrhizobium sp. BWC-3-1]
MKQPTSPSPSAGEEGRKPPSRSDEARRVVEEYAKDLAEIIKRLRDEPSLTGITRTMARGDDWLICAFKRLI